ncbi:MBL fold metallo-hydrolase [Geomicrobium sp. JSM 1781026]|uniref:MBL fold metallo-hydrolase n=1 Tax=Geomicrobium sp. JSM 1781026 TaxID=3344580 RepID=UPI0035C04EF0
MNVTPIGVWGAYPKRGEATSAFLLEEKGFRCLFDCGSGVLSALQLKISLHELDAVVVSHYHPDHVADIGCLQHALFIDSHLGKRTATLPIYAHPYDKEQFSRLDYQKVSKGFPLEAEQSLTVGPWIVKTTNTVHPVDCLAVRFDSEKYSITFTADTAWSEDVVRLAQGSDTLVSEASTYDHMIEKIPGHLSGKQAGELAEAAGVNQLVLTHLPQYGDVADLKKEAALAFRGQVRLARAFSEITIEG